MFRNASSTILQVKTLPLPSQSHVLQLKANIYLYLPRTAIPSTHTNYRKKDRPGAMWRHCKIREVVVMEGGTGGADDDAGDWMFGGCRPIRILCSSPNAHRIRAHPKNTRSRSGAHIMATEGGRRLAGDP
jgi:hypothetical protein